MSNIKIVNVRHWKGEEGWSGIYCGRGRAPHGMEAAGLGNPLKVGQGYTQGEAAAAYLPHLRKRCRTDTHERRTVLALARRYHAGENLALACWCSPKPCHCEAIQAAVVGFAGRM
ncbi:DUF4326 domain-containing protein [Deinococcus sp. SL84]|uniref:DUF4326 domain-containing protein n=1 Tax=Deinococcus sp. SL84 TaxID=2994663 RepID=UPI002274C447|nr:DUF4326 domain-containing protein [Deinococcus sp. SL84]MCY1703842.1 DUF4326 domain-containing protein [Deinococcus sp. SL84]